MISMIEMKYLSVRFNVFAMIPHIRSFTVSKNCGKNVLDYQSVAVSTFCNRSLEKMD